MCQLQALLAKTNRYELTLYEVRTIKWALLVLRAHPERQAADLSPGEIVELENKLVWSND